MTKTMRALFAGLLAAVSGFAAPNAGYIKTLRFVSGATNGINYAVISTSTPQLVPNTSSYVGAEYNGVPYTLLALPSDPVMAALAASSLERAKQLTTAKFYYLDTAAGPNSSLGNVPGIGSSAWVVVINNWHLGE